MAHSIARPACSRTWLCRTRTRTRPRWSLRGLSACWPSAATWPRGAPVEYLTFRGLTFAHSNWTTPPEGWQCGQSESSLWGAVSAVAARHCVFDACKIAHVGTYAIDLGEGCKHNRIENCEITDMGAGGVKIGEMGIRDDEKRLTSHNVIRNNLIAHGGRMHAAGMGVWIGHSPFNLVEHNEICDFYQTGISAGWSWGYRAEPGTRQHDRLQPHP